jgi:integrase
MELKRLIAALERSPSRRLSLIVRALIWTGKRRGELRSLSWKDVDLSSATITLRATNTKSKKAQVFPLNSKALEVFQEAWTLRISYLVFPASTGHYFTDLNNTWKRFREREGFDGLLLHDLRRTAITLWAESGLAPQIIQRLSGHATLGMISRYTHLAHEAVREASEKMCMTLLGS